MSKKTIFFDSYCGYDMSAITESGKLTEFRFEKKDGVSIVGNIYKGRVESVLAGMNAAFINCGLERNCYLSAGGSMPDADKYDCEKGAANALPELKVGDEIAVQVVKAPVGTKGARVTTDFSFVGKFLIYMPNTPFIGVSRKIEDKELRKNLVFSVQNLKDSDEGIVLRTAAPYARISRLKDELAYLRNMYAEVNKNIQTAKPGDLLYSDLELPMRVMRDTLSYETERIIVGTPALEKIISGIASLYPSANRRPVVLHKSGRDLLEEYGISAQISELVSPRVALDNGAYLIIEHTEALTVIDVNTGKFTGDDSLEQTVYYTNILAAREIARQVMLRNIGGIVVVDFIDMSNPAHRASLVGELERALNRDSAKCKVSPMSQFGLVEFTRKRTGGNPFSHLITSCRHCRGGRVKSTRYLLIGLRANLLGLYADGNRTVVVDMNAALLYELQSWQELLTDLKTRCPQAEFYVVPHKSYSAEQIHCRTQVPAPLPEKAVKLL